MDAPLDMFSFDGKREPENHQRFRRAGPTNQGLLALDNPKEEVEAKKACSCAFGTISALFSFLRSEVAARQPKAGSS